MNHLLDEAVLDNLDLLHLAISRCEDITSFPPTVKLKPIQLLVAPGFPQIIIQDPATIAFMTAMRLEGVQQRFKTRDTTNQGQVLLLVLSKGPACVHVPVAMAAIFPLGMDARLATPINLSIRAVLAGLTKTLAHMNKTGEAPGFSRGKNPSGQESENRVFGRASGA